jgi:hypothetical protein
MYERIDLPAKSPIVALRIRNDITVDFRNELTKNI